MKIDIHNHFYPTRFLEHLEKDGSSVGISVEGVKTTLRRARDALRECVEDAHAHD